MENIVIITPCFNENTTVISFLKNIEQVVKSLPQNFEIIVVDDCSSDNTLKLLSEFSFSSANIKLSVLPLEFNVGHQAAIYQGLLYAQKLNSNKFIIMDSDGEDDPEAIAELIGFNDYEIVNVARGRRKESLSFQASYYTYRFIFKIITGKVLNFGNYCMISKRVLNTSCHTSFIHFAAHLSKQKVRSTSIVYNRLKRIDGKSKMNLTSLVHHAFKSFVEYAEELLMIFLKIFAFIIVIFLAVAGVVLYKKFFTNEAILGWASTMMLGLFNVALVCLGFFVIGILLLNMIARKNQDKKEIFVKK
jgi:glycosyltransferase involved in cell wall biosynthesis